MGELGDATHALVGSPAVTRLRTASSERLDDFAAVYEACFPTVLHYMLARVRDPVLAEDLTGDVFERAVGSWHTFERRSSARTWILGIAHHVVANHYRRGSHSHQHLDDLASLLVEPGAGVEQIAEQRDEAARLRQAIGRLSTSDGELLALRYAADLSYREIARVLEAREVTVRVRAHRALNRLSALLRSEET